MALITGKTIYVLGAGASYHAGAPLLRDFLVTARLLNEKESNLLHKDSFGRVFEWIDGLRGSSYYVEFDLDNLEHVFSLAEMSEQLGFTDGEKIFSDLRYVVMETLDRCQIKWQDRQLQPDSVYSEFIKKFENLNDKRMEYTSGSGTAFEKDIIITFNYDVMLDHAMQFNNIKPEYCLYSPPYTGKSMIMKLHGSTNWAFCRDCKSKPNTDLEIIPANPLPKGYKIPGSGLLKEGTPFEFKMVTNVLPNTPCQHCGNKETLEPFIIPPTWSKSVRKTPLAKVWETAVNEIKNAFQIIVIGYSMPPTDTFFQYLLTLGLASNPRLHRVVVVNNDSSEEFKNRYESVFARSLKDRGRLKFLPETFHYFVNDGSMHKVGGIAEWDI